MKTRVSILLGLFVFILAARAAAVECGAEVFISAATYPVTSPVPTELVVADFNGDGFPDIATLGDYYYYETSISILLGNADGTFQEAHTASFIDYGYGMASGQFDAGPTVDLVVTTGADSVAFLAGLGDGTFAPPVFSTFPEPTQLPATLATGDFNEDGDLDLAGGGIGSTVAILRGNGDGTFEAPAGFASGTPASAIAVGDIDGDSDLDVAAGGGNAVAILLGNGDGSLGAPELFVTGNLSDLDLGDVNGDGDLDLAVACSNYAGVMLGNGDGTFQAARKFPAGPAPRLVEIGDFDGDGLEDLAAGNTAGEGSSVVRLLHGDGDGIFVPGATYSTTLSLTALAAADFGNDGLLDLAGTGYQDLVSVMLGNGDGTLQAVRTEAAGIYPYALTAGDFNGDGLSDIASASEQAIRILLATPAGGFAFGQSIPFSYYYSTLLGAGDFDGDEAVDLIASNGYDVYLYPGRGNGTFEEPAHVVGYSNAEIAVADYNQDGKLDFALLPVDALEEITVLLGNGDGTFQAPLESQAVGRTSGVVVAYLNSDGIPDIAVTNGSDCCSGGVNAVTVVLGVGDGTFDPPASYATGVGPIAIAAADFDGNGTLDLASANQDQTVSIFAGNGDGTFQDQVLTGLGWKPYSIVAADFEADGFADIVTANLESDNATLLAGIGNGAFETPVTFGVGADPLPAMIVDLMGNGTPDVVIGNTRGLGGLSLLVNTRLAVGPLPDAGACDGSAATLSAHASGLGALAYHWRRDGAPLSDGGNISGATTANLRIDPATPADDGNYDVVVTDACGQVTSNAAPFTVATAPTAPEIQVDSPPAPGVAGTASVPNLPGTAYTWTIGGDTGAVITAGQGTPQITFLAPIPGTVTLDVVAYSAPGCGTASAQLDVPLDFFDVPSAHPFHADIVEIARAEITAGCGGGNYCPADAVTRAQMSVFLLKGEHGADWTPDFVGNYFLDVPPGSFAADWINYIAWQGITGGCGSNIFCPDNPVTRAQMAVFLLKTLGNYYPPFVPQIFDDVPPAAFAYDFINEIHNQGITGGCSLVPKLYCPDGLVNRGQMAVFIVRAFLEPAP